MTLKIPNRAAAYFHHHRRTEGTTSQLPRLEDFGRRAAHRRQESGWDDARPNSRDLSRLLGDPGFAPPRVDDGSMRVNDPGFAPPRAGDGTVRIDDPGFTPPGNDAPVFGPQQLPGTDAVSGPKPVFGPQPPPKQPLPGADAVSGPAPVFGPQPPPKQSLPGDVVTDFVWVAGQDTSKEDFDRSMKNFRGPAEKNPAIWSAEAHTAYGIYDRYRKAAGPDGIGKADFEKMLTEMRSVKDASAYHALKGLDATTGPISGEKMGDTILRGISDTDGKGNSTELAQFQDWAKENGARLTPAARMALNSYFDIAGKSQARGEPGLTGADMGLLRKQLRGAALADGLE